MNTLLPVPRDLELLRMTIALSENRRPAAVILRRAGGERAWRGRRHGRQQLDAARGRSTQHAELVAAAQAARLLAPSARALRALHQRRAVLHVRRRDPGPTSATWSMRCRSTHCSASRAVIRKNPTFSLPCREVFVRGQRRVEDRRTGARGRGGRAHRGFWTPTPHEALGSGVFRCARKCLSG